MTEEIMAEEQRTKEYNCGYPTNITNWEIVNAMQESAKVTSDDTWETILGVDPLYILDKELVKKYCKDADIVHHLAGITAVPRVKSESNSENDNNIKLVALGRFQKLFLKF